RRASGKWQQRDVARLFDGQGQTTLLQHAHARQASRHNLPALRHELAEQAVVLVVDGFDLLDAELTDFLAPEIFAATFAATRAAGATRTRRTTLSAVRPVSSGRFARCRSGFVSHDAP